MLRKQALERTFNWIGRRLCFSRKWRSKRTKFGLRLI